jgi:hypothetical protein
MDSRRVKTIGLASTILVLIVSSVSSAQASCVKQGVRVYTRPLPAGKVVVEAVPYDTLVSYGLDDVKVGGKTTWIYIKDAWTRVPNKRIGWIPFTSLKDDCSPPGNFVPSEGW